MSTEDDSFEATDSGLFGFLAASDDDNDVPFKPFGVVGYGFMTGVLGFSGEAHCALKTGSPSATYRTAPQ